MRDNAFVFSSQAAIGSFALDIAVDNNVGQRAEELARKVNLLMI